MDLGLSALSEKLGRTDHLRLLARKGRISSPMNIPRRVFIIKSTDRET